MSQSYLENSAFHPQAGFNIRWIQINKKHRNRQRKTKQTKLLSTDTFPPTDSDSTEPNKQTTLLRKRPFRPTGLPSYPSDVWEGHSSRVLPHMHSSWSMLPFIIWSKTIGENGEAQFAIHNVKVCGILWTNRKSMKCCGFFHDQM